MGIRTWLGLKKRKQKQVSSPPPSRSSSPPPSRFSSPPPSRSSSPPPLPEDAVVDYDGVQLHLKPHVSLVDRKLLQIGEYEPPVREAIKNILRPGDVAIDVGAHTGHHTATMLLMTGHAGQILALEPSTERFSLLSKNFSHIPTVRRLKVGLSSSESTVVLSTEPGQSPTIRQVHDNHSVDIPTTTLPLLMEQYSLGSIDLMKMDIEGHECEALIGASSHIESVKNLILEIHPDYIDEIYGRDKLEQMIGVLSSFTHVYDLKNSMQPVDDFAERVRNELRLQFLFSRESMTPRQANISHFKGSADYWEARYQSGGNSGSGSYGRLAQFKADILNDFVKKNDIQSVVEFGCGDGSQLQLADYRSYCGYDVSNSALAICKNHFVGDSSKTFRHNDEYANEVYDLSLSLDVIYHLVEDTVYDAYMQRLFDASRAFVIIYSSNEDGPAINHVRQRKFTTWVEKNRRDWRQDASIPNKYPYDLNDAKNTTFADFFIFSKAH